MTGAVVLTDVDDAHAGQSVRIIAYASVKPEGNWADIRGWLSEALPAYMIPAEVHLVSNLPMRDKVSRKELASTPCLATLGKEPCVLPRTDLERVLLDELRLIVLESEQVGVTDDFFVIGGHSLLAASWVRALREQGVAMSVQDVISGRTVREIAVRIEATLNFTEVHSGSD